MKPQIDKPGPQLVLPSARLQKSFIAAMEEFADEGRCGDDSMIGKDMERFGAKWHTPKGFAALLAKLEDVRYTPPHKNFVCSTTWWWAEGDEFIGRIAVRHELNERLLESGGHIGYDVRRSRRQEGHARGPQAGNTRHPNHLHPGKRGLAPGDRGEWRSP